MITGSHDLFMPPQALSRTYAQSIAGNGVEMAFNHLTSEFKLTYKLYKSCVSNLTEVRVTNILISVNRYYIDTQIYINEQLHYINGYVITVTPSDATKWSSPSKNIIHVEHDTSKLQPGALVTVNIVTLK